MLVTQNYISKNFHILPINLHPKQAFILISESNLSKNKLTETNYGVICRVTKNQVQEVIALVTEKDLKRADLSDFNTLLELKDYLPPTIIVNSQPDAEIKVTFPPKMKESIDNIKGAVVVNNQRVVGVIPASEVRAYLDDLTLKGEVEVGGDVEMGNNVDMGNNIKMESDIELGNNLEYNLN